MAYGSTSLDQLQIVTTVFVWQFVRIVRRILYTVHTEISVRIALFYRTKCIEERKTATATIKRSHKISHLNAILAIMKAILQQKLLWHRIEFEC